MDGARNAYVWRQDFSCERLQLIEETRRLWNELFHEPEGRGHYARIQLSGGKDLISWSSFDGIVDGRKARIHLKVIALRLWYAVKVYRRALAHTQERYPGFDRHHFEDGPRIGERLLIFDSDTHMIAWPHLGTALWKIIEDENITAIESCAVAPCSSWGYVEEQLPYKEYGNQIEEGHYAIRLVVDREPITREFHSEIQEILTKGEEWPLSDTPKSFDFYKQLYDLFTEFSYPELAVLNREEAAVQLRDADKELFEACSYLDINKIRFALDHGANPNALQCKYIDTPLKELVWAVINNRGAIQEPDQKDWYRGKYPVVQLTGEVKTAMVELLLKYGAHPDVHWFEENTPLAIAACNDEEEIVSTLLKYGSDPSIQSFFDSGITSWPSAWEYATDEYHDRTEEEWQAHQHIVAMFEALRPAPYYKPSSEQPIEPQPVTETPTDTDVYAEIQRQAAKNPLTGEPTAAERKYIESSENPGVALSCYYVALAYNTHEPRWILEHCSPDVEYTSQSVFQTLRGIREYGEYLTGKIHTLSQVDATNQARFELGYSPGGKPCVIGYQHQGGFSDGLGVRLLWMDINLDGQEHIKTICSVTCVPPPSKATGTGIFPGISEQ